MLEDNIKKHISCLCETHAAEIITKICTASSCNNRLLCHICVASHNRLHRHSIVPFTEFLNDKIPDVMDIKAINQEREINTFNNTIIFLEKIEHSLEVVLGLMKNSIFKIHRRAMEHREKMKAKAKPKYSHQDWIRFKEYFMQNKKNFLASEPGKVTPELEAFAVHYGSIITKLDEDPSNVSEEEPVLNGAQFDRFIWEGAVSKSLKGIEDLYNDLFSKSFPVNPGKKIPAEHFEYTMGRRINEAKIGSMEASSMGVSPRSHYTDKYSTQNTDRITNIPGRKSVNAKPDFRLKLKTAVPDTEINPPMDSFQSNPPGDLLLNTSRVELKNRDEINLIKEKGSQTPRYGDFRRRDEVRFSIKGNFDIGPGQVTEINQSQSAHKTQRDRRQMAEALNLNKRIVSDNLLSYK